MLRHVDDQAAIAGRDWAGAVRSQLAGEGRAASGGWPGTMTEARVRASQLRGQSSVSPQERARLARILYAAAKDTWAVGATAD